MNLSKPLLLASLGLAFGCAQAHAEDEAKILRLYNWADYFAEDTLANFTEETGIRVIYDVMEGSETLEAKMMSGNSGYDLIFPGDTVAERLMRAGALQKLESEKLEHLADIEPGCATCRPSIPIRGTPQCRTPGAALASPTMQQRSTSVWPMPR